MPQQTVRQKYSSISESFLFEFKHANRIGYKFYYDWWLNLRDLPVSTLRLDQQLQIDKIFELHKRSLTKKQY